MLFADVIMNYGFFRKTNIVNVTSLGYFWKFLSNKYLTKVAQTFYHFGAIFKLISFYVKTCFGYFFGNFWKQFAFFSFQHLVTLQSWLIQSVATLTHDTDMTSPRQKSTFVLLFSKKAFQSKSIFYARNFCSEATIGANDDLSAPTTLQLCITQWEK